MQLRQCADRLPPNDLPDAPVSLLAQGLRALAQALRDYGREMSRLSAQERALCERVAADTPDGGANGADTADYDVRLHRLQSEA
ncbi:MAG: hypothetical protein Q4P32_03485, partial [Micrococcales bacterium]|nr:hypothetical protein [Micrococcales bacterium]